MRIYTNEENMKSIKIMPVLDIKAEDLEYRVKFNKDTKEKTINPIVDKHGVSHEVRRLASVTVIDELTGKQVSASITVQNPIDLQRGKDYIMTGDITVDSYSIKNELVQTIMAESLRLVNAPVEQPKKSN